MSFEIRFINHACFQIIKDDFSILVDPWFSGKIFNNSWSLLQETNINDLDLSNLKYIFISHEHPDHLHWPTLRQIKKTCSQEIDVLMPARHNNNIATKMKELGYRYTQLKPYEFYQNSKHDFDFSFFKFEYDSAIVFDIDGRIIFNKNDCEFPKNWLQEFKDIPFKGRDIDILFSQFSLAGHYANEDEEEKLENARKKHMSDFVEAYEILNPKMVVPFASFVTFCREENQYLNDYVVSLEEMIGNNKEKNIFVPYCLEQVPFELDKDRSKINCLKWSNIFNKEKNKQPKTTPKVELKEMKESYGAMLREISTLRDRSDLQVPHEDFVVAVGDIDKCCKFNFSSDSIEFYPMGDSEHMPNAVVASYDLNFFFKSPWGADSMNISACFKVLNEKLWERMITFRDFCYVR